MELGKKLAWIPLDAGFLLGYIRKYSVFYLIRDGFFHRLFLDHEDEDMFHRNVG
jgi:hypothetical protein